MDRLETLLCNSISGFFSLFIFQYGQIRNDKYIDLSNKQVIIYIPVWIDQKRKYLITRKTDKLDLYSSMDRLETEPTTVYINCLDTIYIPVWIDQKLQTVYQVL